MAISVEDAVLSYERGGKRFNAVDGVSLEIADGEFVAIMGKSGSGKSSLVNLIAGTLRPDSGRVVVSGTDVSSLSDRDASRFRNASIGYIPQSHGLLSSLTAVENVLVPAGLYGKGATEEDALEIMDRLGVRDLARNLPSELSGGEQRRVSIARALINRPGIILADEPTSDLDRDNTRSVMGILEAINGSGATVVVVTHELDAAVHGRRLLVMESGRVREASDSLEGLRSTLEASAGLLRSFYLFYYVIIVEFQTFSNRKPLDSRSFLRNAVPTDFN